MSIESILDAVWSRAIDSVDDVLHGKSTKEIGVKRQAKEELQDLFCEMIDEEMLNPDDPMTDSDKTLARLKAKIKGSKR